jgi:Right handed beta helix region
MTAHIGRRISHMSVIAVFVGAIASVLSTTPAAATDCNGVRVKPGMSIKNAVDQHGKGTTFCLAGGSYLVRSSIHPKSRDRFIGTSPHRRGVVVKTRSAEIIFELGGTWGVTFRHFTIKGARNACPGSTCGETGRAISRGARVTVGRMHLYDNGLNAIGGTSGLLLVRHSHIDHNGASTGDGMSAGIKSTDALSVFDSHISHNRGNGVWCDVQCGDFTVVRSKIARNAASGIFDEISQGKAIFHGNRIVRNNKVGEGFRGGLSITNSKNVIAYDNVFRRNKGFGIAARMDGRVRCGTPDAGCGYVISNVKIHHNALHADSMVGCKLSGVDCYKNRG